MLLIICSTTLSALRCAAQDAPLTPFTLDLSLKSADDCRSSQADLWATQIVSISTELQIRHGVNVCIHLQSASGATTMLPASALQLLAPLLYSIDMYTVPHQQTALSNHTSAVLFSGFTPAHIAALQYCSDGLSALCVSDLHASDAQPVASIAGHMAVIAQLSGLSKLHLSLGGSQDANFEPLSQLSSVQDLALQSPRRGVSCTGILTSSRLTLRHIILTAESWSLDTYTALQQLRHLQKLLIKLYVMSAADGAALARVKATYLHLDLRQCNDTSGLSALSSADPASQIHELTLWGLDDHCCYHLESLPSLQVLTIVNSPRLTGVCTWQHSKVSELKMINCPGITAKGLVHMLNTALPAISKVMCLAGSNTDSINHLQINPHLVHALSCGRNLTYVDLRGVRGLSLAGVQQLRSAFTAIQEHGVAQAKVKLILPCREHFCQPTIKVFDSFYCPTFCQVPDSPSLSRHQIFEWQNADKLGALLFSAWLFCILQFSSGRQAT